MRLDLPSFINHLDVIGVTKGSPRWTVYFKQGGRFTQMHRSRDNIGYHAPEPHFFFGNVDEAPIVAKQQELAGKHDDDDAMYAEYAEFLCSYGADNIRLNKTVKPTPPRPNEPVVGKRLLEVKGKRSDPSGHNSRSALAHVSIDEAKQLLADIRSRSTTITQDAATGQFIFA